MGNILQRLFSGNSSDSNQSRRSHSKRKSDQVTNLNNNNNNNNSNHSAQDFSNRSNKSVEELTAEAAAKNGSSESILFHKTLNNNSLNDFTNNGNNTLAIASSSSITQHKSQTNESSDTNYIQSQLDSSPFQRDFLQPHQLLISPQKERIRQSKTRRSARVNASMGKGNRAPMNGRTSDLTQTHDGVNDIVTLRRETNLDSIETSEISNKITTNDVENYDEANRTVDGIAVQNHQPSIIQSSLDELPPNERQKAAKSRISEMFIRRQRQPPQPSMHRHTLGSELDANGLTLQHDYTRVYKNIDQYGHYTINEDHSDRDASPLPHHENGDEVDREQDLQSRQPESPNHMHAGGNDDNAVFAQLSDKNSAPVPMRRKPKMFGNPMLIDELKKRQSSLYPSTETYGGH